MKKSFVVGLSLLGCFAVCAIIYAQITANPSIQTVKISTLDANAEFASADKNSDGVLNKEEFKAYLTLLKAAKTVAKNEKKNDSCCSNEAAKKNTTETVDIKSVTETPVKRDITETVDGKSVTEIPVKKDVAETVDGKSAAETPVKKECSCCSGKTGKKETESKLIPKSISSVRLPDHLVEIVLKATNALSSDNLAEYQNHLPQLIEAIKVTDNDVCDFLAPFAEKLVMGGNLKEARQPFEPFSNTFADIIKSQPAGERQAYIFQCPMSPVLGKAQWIQKQNKKVLNPFFGSEMLNCGIELQ
ncbi:MAG: hypothetical protein LBF88_10890 [Planctomycetaceae bacterium]|jgi:hypothetical protein|nr:hypothetical protein [Planctomycetaceae bacterium]